MDIFLKRPDPDILVSDLLTISKDPRYQDITIICSDGRSQCNSLVLATIFPTFHQILETSVCKEEQIMISLPDVDTHEFSSLYQSLITRKEEILLSTCDFLIQDSLLQPKIETLIENYDDEEVSDEEFEEEDNFENKPIQISFLKPPNSELTHQSNSANTEEHENGKISIVENKTEEDRQLCPKCHAKVKISKHTESKCLKLLKSYKQRKSRKFECEICGKSVTDIWTHNSMIHGHGKEARKQCPYCLKMVQKMGLSNHVKRIHTNPEDYKRCPKCKSEVNVKTHTEASCQRRLETYKKDKVKRKSAVIKKETLTIRKEKRAVCSICGLSVVDLKAHIRNVHTEREKSHFCDICAKNFSSPQNLLKHMAIHEPKTTCPECGKSVRKISDHMLQSHAPDSEKPYQCKDCGKGFLTPSSLEAHRVSVHLKTRPYGCRYGCEFRYNDLSNRNAHERKTHGGLFPSDGKKEDT